MFNQRLGDDAELVLLRPHMAEALFAVVDRNRAHLRPWLPWVDLTLNVEHGRQFILRSLNDLATNGSYQCSIRVGGAIAGVIGCLPIDWVNKKTEIGYWLDEAHQGKGLMTRAARAVVDDLLRVLGVNRVVIRCAVDNRRSAAVAERLGFRREGVERQAGCISGRWVDMIVYAMVAGEWRG